MTKDTGLHVTPLSEEQLNAIQNDIALSLHSWVRDITCGKLQSRRFAVLQMLESAITTAVGSDLASPSQRQRYLSQNAATRWSHNAH